MPLTHTAPTAGPAHVAQPGYYVIEEDADDDGNYKAELTPVLGWVFDARVDSPGVITPQGRLAKYDALVDPAGRVYGRQRPQPP
jgi:hypothetical protein